MRLIRSVRVVCWSESKSDVRTEMSQNMGDSWSGGWSWSEGRNEVSESKNNRSQNTQFTTFTFE